MAVANDLLDREKTNLIDEGLALIGAGLSDLSVVNALSELGRCRNWIDAEEARLLASRLEAGFNRRHVTKLASSKGTVAKKDAKVRTKRAQAVQENRDLADKLENHQLSTGQLDVIAEAAAKTDGAAALDQELIDEIAGLDPDQGRKRADEYVRGHQNPDAVQSAYDKARAARDVRTYDNDERGTTVLHIEGDKTTITEMYLSIQAGANTLYDLDGGRDIPGRKHSRTYGNRLFDVAAAWLTDPLRNDENDGDAKNTIRSQRVRSTVVVTATVDKILGRETALAELIGTGPIPDSVLESYACTSDFVGMVFGGDEELLWLGQAVPFATEAQVLGLVARDKGCVLCGAHYSRCEAHHLVPRSAPAKGPTDIDNLALVCADCHHRIHGGRLTLYYDPIGREWKLRTATAVETPPPRPDSSRARRQQQTSRVASNLSPVPEDRGPAASNTDSGPSGRQAPQRRMAATRGRVRSGGDADEGDGQKPTFKFRLEF